MPRLYFLKPLTSFLIMIALVSNFGCSDPCNKTVCVNGGACVDGHCDCPSGYSGDSCNYETRSFFYGTYNVHDVCTLTGVSDYTVNISEVPGQLLKVYIANFANSFSNNVTATISGNHISIATQSPDNDGRVLTGSGTLSVNTIQMSYSIAGATGTNTCDQSTWVK